MLQVSKISFRWCLKHHLHILLSDHLRKEFHPYEELLVFGYIDSSGEMKFKVVAGIIKGNVIPLFQKNQTIAYAMIAECVCLRDLKLDEKMYMLIHQYEKSVMAKYWVDAYLQLTRNDRRVDEYRHPSFPDWVLCWRDDEMKESVYVQMVGYDGEWLQGKVIGEGNQIIRLDWISVPHVLDRVLVIKK